MRLAVSWILAAALPSSALAQIPVPDMARPNTIVVAATGKVETVPDMATMALSVRADGKTPDAATSALAARQKAIIAGLRGIDPKLEARTGDIVFREIRGGDCTDAGGSDEAMMADMLDSAADSLAAVADGNKAGSGKGPCRVTGHRATIDTTILLAAVKDAGTAAGLAGRLGASEARIESFGLRDDTAAARRALDQAMVNARAQASALAAVGGARLGPILSIVNSDASRRLPIGGLVSYSLALPAALAQQPVRIDIAPTPVETSAQFVVTFALLP